MKDKNGTSFEVGSSLQSIQSTQGAGTINCIAINGNTATFSRDESGEKYFNLDQNNINSSEWVVCSDKTKEDK